MKYYLKMSCGHTQMMSIHGCAEHIEKKLKFFRTQAVCTYCYMQQQLEKNLATDHVEITVPYHEYKIRYRNLPFVPNSYNAEEKTIIVCMPKALAERFAERQAEKDKARLEREEKMRLKAQAKAAMAKPENLINF